MNHMLKRVSQILLLALMLALLATAFVKIASDAKAADGLDCPTYNGSVMNSRFAVNGTTVGMLRGNVLPGSIVTVTFDIAADCENIPVSLASYEATSEKFQLETVDQQNKFDSDAGIFATGTGYTLSVTVPNCFFQVDFARSAILAIPLFGDTYLDADNGGIAACGGLVPTTTPTPTPAVEPASNSGSGGSSGGGSSRPRPTTTPTVTPTPTPTGQVLGGSVTATPTGVVAPIAVTPTLPRTGASPASIILLSLFFSPIVLIAAYENRVRN